jgi:2-phospho-L-lactate guanylyltransferase
VISVVVPFRSGGKTRLPDAVRADVAIAMLGDVLETARSCGPVVLVTADPVAAATAGELGAVVVSEPGGGQGAAVGAALAALDGPCLVVNADCPCVRVAELEALAAVARAGRIGLVRASDGTTNALALPAPAAFAPLYGAGSAARFEAHGAVLGLGVEVVPLAGLEEDVDTLDDLERLLPAAGPRTRAVARGVLT